MVPTGNYNTHKSERPFAVPTGKEERERVRAACASGVRSSLDPHRNLEQEKERATICGPHRKRGTGAGASGAQPVRAAMCADVRSSLDPDRKLEHEQERATICDPHWKTGTGAGAGDHVRRCSVVTGSPPETRKATGESDHLRSPPENRNGSCHNDMNKTSIVSSSNHYPTFLLTTNIILISYI